MSRAKALPSLIGVLFFRILGIFGDLGDLRDLGDMVCEERGGDNEGVSSLTVSRWRFFLSS